MMRRRPASLLLSLVLLASCQSEPAFRPEKVRIVLGVLGTFTGEGSEAATGILRGAQVAVDEYNADPDSTFEVTIKKSDTGGTAEGAVASAQGLAGTERIVGVVGPFK